MGTLLVFGSKYGSTKKCAEFLREKLNGNVEVVDIKMNQSLDLNLYDKIVIGTSVYMGKIQKEISEFCKSNIEVIKTKKVAVFLCCMNEKDFEKQINENFSKEMLDAMIVKGYFGGEFNFTKMNFIEKNIIKMVAKTVSNEDEKFKNLNMKKDMSMLKVDNIEMFTKAINNC
jgi:menaquinone-dependent protoporphyrinogen oxidase